MTATRAAIRAASGAPPAAVCPRSWLGDLLDAAARDQAAADRARAQLAAYLGDHLGAAPAPTAPVDHLWRAAVAVAESRLEERRTWAQARAAGLCKAGIAQWWGGWLGAAGDPQCAWAQVRPLLQLALARLPGSQPDVLMRIAAPGRR